MALAVAILLIAGALVACLLPLLAEEAPGKKSADAAERAAELAAEREAIFAALRDSDLDLAMGKVSPADHALVKQSLEARAISVLAALEAERGRRPSDGGGVPSEPRP